LPLGRFELLDDALGCAADFGAATSGRLVEEWSIASAWLAM
jgi:hypothetical protein